MPGGDVVRLVRILFDVEEAARRALGRHWQARTPAERGEFVQLFTDLLERSYIGKIETYSGGERIQYLGESVEGNQATVRTRAQWESQRESFIKEVRSRPFVVVLVDSGYFTADELK